MTTVLAKKEVNEFQMEDAVALAKEIERYEAALKIMKEKLKAFVQLNGPVQANGKVWDFIPSSTWKFSAEQLKALAGMMVFEGLNPYDYLSLSSNAIKKLKWSEEILSHYGEKEAGKPSFRSVKIENYKK